MSDRFATIRARCAAVAERARHVRLVPSGIGALAERLMAQPEVAPAWDEETHYRGDPDALLAYVLSLESVNFGSGWFPRLRKRPGRSGYYTVALGLKERFEAAGPWSAEELNALETAELARILGQDAGDPDVAELLSLFTRALRDLGRLVRDRHGGRFAALVAEAGGSAQTLVALLARMPFFRDVGRYAELEVPFYKRAQLAAADLALAFEGKGPGRFEDLARLTAFADNLVPHVLRLEGALEYAPELLRRIEAGALLAAGTPEEVEIRAAAVHGVERLVEALRRQGAPATAQELDFRLWHRGQRPEFKAQPRHRTRSVYY